MLLLCSTLLRGRGSRARDVGAKGERGSPGDRCVVDAVRAPSRPLCAAARGRERVREDRGGGHKRDGPGTGELETRGRSGDPVLSMNQSSWGRLTV